MIVFWPSMRNGLSELPKYTPSDCADSRTSRRQSSKSPRTNKVRAPYATVCASFPIEILPTGTITSAGIPACAAYEASELLVFPVEAQAIAVAPHRRACVTATVMPRSLNDPVGL